MKASVIIPTRNRCGSVVRTVESVLQQHEPAQNYEVIVIVDGSTDNTAATLRRRQSASRVKVVEQENRGPAGARNAGWRTAAGELLVFLDDDMWCTPNWLEAHLAAHETPGREHHVGMGAISGPPDRPPTLADEVFARGMGAEFARHRDHPDAAWPPNVWSFANTSVNRSVIEVAGGFDERFRLREDCELGVRLLDANVRQRFVAEAVTYQSAEKSAEQIVREAEAYAEYDFLFSQLHPGFSPHEFAERLKRESPWKRAARHMLADHPELTDALLAPMCALGEGGPAHGLVRELAVRALLFRCGLHWYRRMGQISGVRPERLRHSEAAKRAGE